MPVLGLLYPSIALASVVDPLKLRVEETTHDEYPLGRYYRDIAEDRRVQWVSHPASLIDFLASKLEECQQVAPAVDQVVKQMTGK
jgi:hypothetical protein